MWQRFHYFFLRICHLIEVVPREIYSKTEALLKAAKEDILKLRHEMEQLKEIALISVSQNQTFEEHQAARDIEAESFRQQLIAIESKDDDRANLARLHRQLTRLQVNPSKNGSALPFLKRDHPVKGIFLSCIMDGTALLLSKME